MTVKPIAYTQPTDADISMAEACWAIVVDVEPALGGGLRYERRVD